MTDTTTQAVTALRVRLVHEQDDPPYCREAADMLAALASERDELRICARLHMDLTNHHNAARCPYCNPDLQKQIERERTLVAERDALAAQLAAARAAQLAAEAKLATARGALRQIASYGPDEQHNHNRNDLIACEAVSVAEAAIRALAKGGE